MLVGWLWYLGMLVPVIGLLQVGGQTMADRYTYLPQIGLALGLVWAVTDLADFLAARAGSAVRRAGRFLLALSAAGIIAALAVDAWRQTGYWRNSETLWVRDMMYPNLVAHYNLGLALAKTDRHREAIEQYQAALAIDPNDRDTHNNLGLSYEALGKLDDAAREFRWILAEIQKAVEADNKLAEELQLQGKSSEAQEHRRAGERRRRKNPWMRTRISHGSSQPNEKADPIAIDCRRRALAPRVEAATEWRHGPARCGFPRRSCEKCSFDAARWSARRPFSPGRSP